MPRKKAKTLPPYDEQTLPGPVRPQAINEELGMMRYVEKETGDEYVLMAFGAALHRYRLSKAV